MSTHYFLALPVPAPVSLTIGKSVSLMKPHLPFEDWHVPQDYHITLRFLGNVDTSQQERLCEQLPSVLRSFAPISLSLTHVGTFGLTDYPRVFWLGPDHERQLFALQEACTEALTRIGFPPENRPYRPHVTLAKKYRGEAPFLLSALQSQFSTADLSWTADAVILYQVRPKQTPRYDPVAVFSLLNS